MAAITPKSFLPERGTTCPSASYSKQCIGRELMTMTVTRAVLILPRPDVRCGKYWGSNGEKYQYGLVIIVPMFSSHVPLLRLAAEFSL